MALVLKGPCQRDLDHDRHRNIHPRRCRYWFEAFSSVGDGNTTYYACTDGTDFEVGIGTYTASGTTLARTTILQSSNSDNAVSWGAGTRTLFCTLPAEKMIFNDANNAIQGFTDNSLAFAISGVTHG